MARKATRSNLSALLINLAVSAFAVIVTAYVLPGVKVDGFTAALITAIILGLANAFLRPFLLFLTLPLNILTLGLFTFVVNAFLVMLTASIVPGFGVASFWWALGFSLILSLVNSFLHHLSS